MKKEWYDEFMLNKLQIYLHNQKSMTMLKASVLIIAFFILLFFMDFPIVTEAYHDCPGSVCTVCDKPKVTYVIPLSASFAVFAIIISSVILNPYNVICFQTLISNKVRLNN